MQDLLDVATIPTPINLSSNTSKLVKLLSNGPYFMSLLRDGAIIGHLVVIKLLHGIQFTTPIQDPKLGQDCVSHILAHGDGKIQVNNVLAKNTDDSTRQKGVGIPKNFLSSTGVSSPSGFPLVTSNHLMVVSHIMALARHLV
jgi:hypothetical protein